MRHIARKGILAAAIVSSAALAGCCHPNDYQFGSLVAESRTEQATAARSRKLDRTVMKRVAEPKVVHAGSKIRSFCGQRHVRFQSGALRESASEKARNDVLCSQVY